MALQSVDFPWYKDIEEQEEALLESQEDSEVQQGQGVHSLLHSAVEFSTHEDSREEVEQDPPQPEQDVNVQDLVLEAQRQASFQATLDAFFGHSSCPQPPSQARRLKSVGHGMLHSWYHPEQGSVWLDGTVFNKLNSLKLVPVQQVVLDQGLRSD